MTLLVILWAASIFLGLGVWYESDDVVEGISALAFGFMVSWLAAVIVGWAVYGDQDTKRVAETHALVNISDRMSVEGHFYLFGGSIEGVPQYAWYEETSANTFRQKSADADDSDIHYILDGGQPRYVVTREKCVGRALQDWGFAGPCDDTYVHYDFYVPKGSITNTYRLDAQ